MIFYFIIQIYINEIFNKIYILTQLTEHNVLFLKKKKMLIVLHSFYLNLGRQTFYLYLE
jgi:hypothetical protein